ncbi:MAG: hypothetical protein ABFS39_00130 [Pseudomonadota bacterium]
MVGPAASSISGKSNRNSLLLLLALVVLITFVILLTATLKSPEAMGSTASPIPWLTVGLLYLCMLAGIAAQYFFFASEKDVFRWQTFIKPFLASPVIFIPLASSYQEALHPFESFSMADLMILLAAFQNGFFWKIVFDRIAGEQEEAKS